jgi:putative tryptophan/tyrosine transport system substrate-binding protein
MRTRRDLITLLGGAAAWPFAARAEQKDRVRRIGLLMASIETDPIGQERVQAFRRGLNEFGWVEGRNLEILLRWSGVDVPRIQTYTAELVHAAPDLIVANATPVIAALKRATQSIPLVFVVVNDPVAQGIVSSVARPEGNITGFSFLDYSVVEKSLELLKQVAPDIAHVGVMFNPETYPYYNVFLRAFEASAQRLSVEVTGTPIHGVTEVEDIIAKLARQPGSGLILPPDPFTTVHRRPIINATEYHRIPAISFFRQFVREGALMSYGADTADIFRRSANYVDRILKGAKPADLPVQAPTKYELVINLKTAKALRLDVPDMLLATADEVIE